MPELTWWRIACLALFFYLQLALSLCFYYLFALCRLAEGKFARPTRAPLLFVSLAFFAACSLGLAVSPSLQFGRPWFAACSCAAALPLALVSVKCYRAMMGG